MSTCRLVFLPWHRGYLHYFESILANWIKDQGGPNDWALPYWNYLNSRDPNSRKIPHEFLDPTINGVEPNPLSQAIRGPAKELGLQKWIPVDISLNAQTSEAIYTAEPGTLGYGGPISGFAQQGNAYGAIESDPHNYVHVMIGGDNSEDPQGWMYDPNFAALDPIFWVHHCNVDRLWAAWMTDMSHEQEKSQPWRNGPFPRQYTMPDLNSNLAVFLPSETLPGEPLEPIYDDLTEGTGITPPSAGVFGMVPKAQTTKVSSGLIGANKGAISISGMQVKSSIFLTSQSKFRSEVFAKRRVYLNVEGVKGNSASGVLNVTLTAHGSNPNDVSPKAIKTLVFFGLANATSAEGPHGGNGLSATVEITDIANQLMSDSSNDFIEAYISQPEGKLSELTVDRISIYTRGQD